MESSKNAKQDIMLVRSGNPPNNPNYVGNTFDLDYEWRILASVEGGEALIRLAEDSPWIEVKLPLITLIRANGKVFVIHKLFEGKGIEIDKSIKPEYSYGFNEAIVKFCLETAGRL
jgi:hypothetical protein